MAEIVDDDLALGSDLKVKVNEAWRDFARALTTALSQLPEGAQLDLTLDPTASGTGDAIYGVSVQRGSGDALSGLAVGNSTLPAGYRLDRSAVADLVALGWSPPGVLAGSGEDFGYAGNVAQANICAAMLTRTLRDVYGAPHPAFLMYAAQDENDTPVPVPPLANARPVAAPQGDPDDQLDLALPAVRDRDGRGDRDEMPLAEQVPAIVAALLKTDPDALQVDGDGDIGIRSGSAMVFVRVRDNPPLVDVFSPVLTEIEPTEALYVKLSELTNRMPIGRLYCANETVWASIPVFGRDFQPTHLMLAVQVMTGLADELDDRLHGEFGGKRFFGDTDAAHGRGENTGERTGMYL